MCENFDLADNLIVITIEWLWGERKALQSMKRMSLKHLFKCYLLNPPYESKVKGTDLTFGFTWSPSHSDLHVSLISTKTEAHSVLEKLITLSDGTFVICLKPQT